MQAFSSDHLLGEAQRYWQMSLVRGILAILAGLIIVCWPRQSFLVFFYVFGVFAIVEGCVMAAHGLKQMSVSSELSGAAHRGLPGAQGATRTQDRTSSRKSSARAQNQTASQEDLSPTGAPAAYQKTTSTEGDALAEEPPAYEETSAPQGKASHLSNMPYLSTLIKHGGITQVGVGVASVVCGILCLILPGFVGALVVYVVAIWALFRGIGMLMQVRERGWAAGAIGVLAIILSLFLFIDPIGAIRTFLWGVGVFLLIAGIVQVVRGIQHSQQTAPPLEPTY
jgi:uncharacterized membrane protein HdeD (DUF308 family)